MLLQDESCVIKWLSQYGALPKTQLVRMLRKPPDTAEKILNNLRRASRIENVGDVYYIGLDSLCQPDQRVLLAGYEIVVLYEGEGNLLRLLQPQDDLKYIIVLPHISMAAKLKLPKAPCLFATIEFQGKDEPEILFYSEEAIQNEVTQRIPAGSEQC